MKKLLFGLILLTLIPFTVIGQNRSSSDVYVNGYVRKNGTVVPGYYRSAPNNTNRDNFSTRGNINPYTKSKGNIDPDNSSRNSTYSYSNGIKTETRVSSNNLSNFSSNKLNKNKEPKPNFYNDQKNFKAQDSIEVNYFYALDKRWVGLKNNLKFNKGSYTNQWISINIGIKTDGGGLIMAKSADMDETEYRKDDRHKVIGTLKFYLENGDIIKCVDRKAYDRFNKIDYTFYNLTRKEIHLLEINNISAIEFIVYFDFEDNFSNGINYGKPNKSLKYVYENKAKCTKCNISELFKPFWTKRIKKTKP